MDGPTNDRINLLHPAIRSGVIDSIITANILIAPIITIRIVQGLRTIEEQNNLYAIGRSKPGAKVTNAKGGSSFHNYGLAIDFAFLVEGKVISWDVKKDWDQDHVSDWLEVVAVFKRAGYEWGGDWKNLKDYPHFQKSFGFTWQQLLEKYKKQDFITGTRYVKL